jgi:hypothetical protein
MLLTVTVAFALTTCIVLTLVPDPNAKQSKATAEQRIAEKITLACVIRSAL